MLSDIANARIISCIITQRYAILCLQCFKHSVVFEQLYGQWKLSGIKYLTLRDGISDCHELNRRLMQYISVKS